jgi:hypothetical protein
MKRSKVKKDTKEFSAGCRTRAAACGESCPENGPYARHADLHLEEPQGRGREAVKARANSKGMAYNPARQSRNQE